MNSYELDPKHTEEVFKCVEGRVANDIGAVIVAPGVSEKISERLSTTLKGRTPVIVIKGASLVEPTALARAETLYEVVVMETKMMNYFAPEALLRGITDGFTPVLERLNLKLSPVEGFFELLNRIFPRGISAAILTGLIVIECLGWDVIGTNQDLIVVAGSTQAGGLDTAIVLRPSRSRDLFLRTEAVVKEILVMPRPTR